MTLENQNTFGPGADELRSCLHKRRSFWFYGLKGCGKSHRLRRQLENLTSQGPASVAVIDLFPRMSRSQWAEAIFSALPMDHNEPKRLRETLDGGSDPAEAVEEIWRTWCTAYEEAADDVFIVIDGWQWMPDELRRGGVRMIFDRGLSCGFVACAAPQSYVWADQLIKLRVIACPPLSRAEESQLVDSLLAERGRPELATLYQNCVDGDRTGHPMHAVTMASRLIEFAGQGQESALEDKAKAVQFARQVRLGLCRNLLEVFDEPCLHSLAPLARLNHPLPRHLIWRHFERDPLLPAIDYGMLHETVDSLSLAPALRGIMSEFLTPTEQQWWQLLRCLWECFESMTDGVIQGGVDHGLVQMLLDVFAKTCNAGKITAERRAFLAQVMEGIDKNFSVILTAPRLPAALSALETIPPTLHSSMPAIRFRLSQCLVMVGRRNQADKLLRGLLRMKNTDAGKRAFVWTRMFAAHEGNADEAVADLMAFLHERITPGSDLDALARRVLAMILTFRGLYRRALPIIEGGIRAARANDLAWDLHLLRNLHGLCLTMTGEEEMGLALMHDACDRLLALGLELPHVEARHRLAVVYFELEQFDEARRQFRQIRPEYERFDDRRNLHMLDVMEHLIGLSLGEEEPPPWGDLDRTPAETEWSYYQAELNFAEALHAIRRGDEESAIRSLKSSLEIHLANGTVRALSRLLRHYLPLLLSHHDIARARHLLDCLQPHHLQQRELGSTAPRLVEAVYLTGNFGDLELLGQLSSLSGDQARPPLFARILEHSLSPNIASWINTWEEMIAGLSEPGDDKLHDASPELAALYRAWESMDGGDVRACKLALLDCHEIELEGSLFGFLRGILHYAVALPGRGASLRGRREILDFWHRLPAKIVVQQLRFWESTLDAQRHRWPPELVGALDSWLEPLQKWRVDQAMLLDESLGEVFFDGRRFELGSDTLSFSVVRYLARRQATGKPVPVHELFEAVWERPYSPPSSNSNVYVAIGALRQDLDVDSRNEPIIDLERGHGYFLAVPAVLAPNPQARA